MQISFDRRSTSNNWEPHPYDADQMEVEKQKSGFLKRYTTELNWKKLKQENHHQTIRGISVAKLRSLDVCFTALLQEELVCLSDQLWFGFPDPPRWRLFSISLETFDGQDWGYFWDLPGLWVFDEVPEILSE